MRLRRTISPALIAIVMATACRATAPAADAGTRATPPADANQPGDPAASVQTRVPDYTRADVRFMQGMIVHHAQALAMTSLVPERADSEGIRLLARRIEISQRSEIGLMQDWLRERGRDMPIPDTIPDLQTRGRQTPSEMQGPAIHEQLMPGMLTHEQMLRLARATGGEFDRLFLKLMIQHHRGALTMVGNLFAAGGAQEPATYNFVTHVDSSQRMEIRRMRSMLEELAADDRER